MQTVGQSGARGSRSVACFIVLILLSGPGVGFASEYGISTYRPGLLDLFPGILPPAGTAMVKNYFMYQDASARVVTEDGRIEARTRTYTYTVATFAAYMSHIRFLGAP